MLIFLEKIKGLVLCKSFFLGAVLATGIFSKYIFGNDNLLEEIAELFIKQETGVQVDLSDDEKDEIAKYRELYMLRE